MGSMQQEIEAAHQHLAQATKASNDLVIAVSSATERSKGGIAARDLLAIHERQQDVLQAQEALRKRMELVLLRVERTELNMRHFAVSAALPELMRAPDTTPFFAHNNVSPDTTFLVRAENPSVPPLDPAGATAPATLPPFIQVKKPRQVGLV